MRCSTLFYGLGMDVLLPVFKNTRISIAVSPSRKANKSDKRTNNKFNGNLPSKTDTPKVVFAAFDGYSGPIFYYTAK